MVVSVEVDTVEAKVFADFLLKLRNRVGTELESAQQEAKIAPLTTTAVVLGRLSASLAAARTRAGSGSAKARVANWKALDATRASQGHT